MYLTPETTAILVADRRSNREAAARRYRWFTTAVRHAVRAGDPAPTRLRVPDGRTPSETPARAA